VLAHHDEDRAYREEVAALRAAGEVQPFDWVSCAVSFKGTFLEGIEVAFLVLTLGAAQGDYLPPTVGAVSALVIVVLAAAWLRLPLARVPENALKFTVGAMLCTFGVYWVAEGVGVVWTGGAAALGYLLAAILVLSWFTVRWVQRTSAAHSPLGS
jgi:uncharacterized membrane protein